MSRQTERERELQARYDKLNFDLQNLQVDSAQAATSGAVVEEGGGVQSPEDIVGPEAPLSDDVPSEVVSNSTDT